MKGETVFTEGCTASGTITFPEGNQVLFGQDMGWYLGVPPGIAFTVKRITDNGHMWLEAPGYGEIGNYGNGQIVVYMEARPKEHREEVIREAVRRLSNADLGVELSKAKAPA